MIYTDRSRQKAHFHCPMDCFLAYYFGGKGISGKGTSIPLATGSHSHSAVELILKESWNENPKSSLVRDVVDAVTVAYHEEVAEAGFLDPEVDETRVLYVLEEQTTLISGLIWAWASYTLPTFLENFEVLHVEQEMEKIVGCDCGLSGVGEVADHKARGCHCLVIMTRPDIIAKEYSSNALHYIEIKTGGKIEPGTFEGDIQFAFGAAGVEGFTGKELTASYVHALTKGYRVSRNEEPKKQESPLCYAWYKPGIDSLVPADIKFRWGKGVSKKSHTKTPVWEIPFDNKPKEIPVAEHYISLMDDAELESHVKVFGPFSYPKQQVEELLEDAFYLETRNNEVYSYVADQVKELGFAEESVQQAVHEFIPKSWDCRRWGKQICQYYPICMKQSGWEDPCKHMNYVERTANHPIEFVV